MKYMRCMRYMRIQEKYNNKYYFLLYTILVDSFRCQLLYIFSSVKFVAIFEGVNSF